MAGKNELIILSMLFVVVVFFIGLLTIDSPNQVGGRAVQVDGTFNIQDFAPVIEADSFIGDAGDLVTITVNAYDPNGNTTTYNFSAPLNASGQWQSTANDSGVFYANITATDGLQISVKTVAIKLRPYCGDGNLTDPEECDDGNNIDGDGCDSVCKIEPAPQPPAGGGGGGGGAPPVEEPVPEPETPRPELPPLLPPRPRTPRPVPESVEPSPEPVVPIPEVTGPAPINEVISSYTFIEGDSTAITAVDAQGNPIPDAGVRVTLPDGSQVFFKTDPEGKFGIDFKEPGEYDILIYKAGRQSKHFRVAVSSTAVEEVPGVLSVAVIAGGGIALAIAIIILAVFLELFVVWKLKRRIFKRYVKHEIIISNISRILKRKAHNIYIIVKTSDKVSDFHVDNYRDVHVKKHQKGDTIYYSFTSHKKPFHIPAGKNLLVSFKVHGKKEPHIMIKHSSWLPWSRHATRVKRKSRR